MAQLLLGAPAARALDETTAASARALSVVPTLACIRVGDNPSALSYERALYKRADTCGCSVRSFVFAESDATTSSLIDTIKSINADPSIHACLLFRPLPRGIDERAVCETLDSAKDVDGITALSLSGVFTGEAIGFAPCTAEAVVHMLEHYEVPLEGAHVCVVGRSLVIGRPVSMLLQHKNATVTMCHSKTSKLAQLTRSADIIVAAVGRAGFIDATMVSPNQTIIDVGINWDEHAQKIVGDVNFAEVEPIVRAISPVPRGVGSLTTSMLMHHVVLAAKRSCAQ